MIFVQLPTRMCRGDIFVRIQCSFPCSLLVGFLFFSISENSYFFREKVSLLTKITVGGTKNVYCDVFNMFFWVFL